MNQNPEQLARDQIDTALMGCGWVAGNRYEGLNDFAEEKKKYGKLWNAPASELLRHIKAEKEKSSQSSKSKKSKVQTIAADEIPFDLPEGWVWCRLGEVIELISGQHIEAADYNQNGIGLPYLTGPSDFGTTNPIFTRWSVKPRVLAQKGDVLITVKGSGVGKLNILHENNVAIGRQLMAVRVSFLEKDFVRIYLDSIFEKLQNEKAGIAIPGISREDILEKLFCLPSLLEQCHIVAKVQQLLKMVDQLELQVATSQAQTQQLLQAVLKETFGGKKKEYEVNELLTLAAEE